MLTRLRANVIRTLIVSLVVGVAFILNVPLPDGVLAHTDVVNPDPMVVKPYTIQYRVTMIDWNGKEAGSGEYLVAGKSNGDTVQQGLEPNAIREITFLRKGVFIAVSPSGNNIMTGGSGFPRPSHRVGDTCEELPGYTNETKVLLGFQTFKTAVSNDGPRKDGHVIREVNEAWVAPELNCMPLEKIDTWLWDGKADAVTKQTALWAVAAEPNARLSDLPVHPNEVPPSMFWPALGRNIREQAERAYFRDKAQRAAAVHP